MYREKFLKVTDSAKDKVALFNKGKFRYLVSAMLGSAYVGITIMFIFTIGALLNAGGSPATKIVMGAAFGAALSLVLLAGGDLFTSNAFIMTAGVLNKTSSLLDLAKIWASSYIGNIIGALIGVYLYFLTGLGNGAVGEFMVHYAELKMNETPIQLITRGFFCNLLVCVSVWCVYKLKEETAKLIMIFWCLFIFLTTGFEHSIANMTLLALGLVFKHPETVSVAGYFYNIGFVTLGNAIAGVILAASYWLISKED